jgi:hypothetical protein
MLIWSLTAGQPAWRLPEVGVNVTPSAGRRAEKASVTTRKFLTDFLCNVITYQYCFAGNLADDEAAPT